MPNAALPKNRVTNEQNVHKMHTTSRNIAGTVDQLNRSLVELEAGLCCWLVHCVQLQVLCYKMRNARSAKS